MPCWLNVTSSKMNRAGPVTAPFVTTKSVVVLKTMPVGDEAATSSPAFAALSCVVPVYRVLLLLAWLLVHSGVGVATGPNAMPQGFFSLSSTTLAPTFERSEARLVWVKACPGPGHDPDRPTPAPRFRSG